jgi:hypothetical protein
MKHITCPWDLLNKSLSNVDQPPLDVKHYRNLGVVVVRNAVPVALIADWGRAWDEFQRATLGGERKVDPYNPVVLHEAPSQVLDNIHSHPALLDLLQKLYPDLALYVQRFVIKDKQSRQPVFVHQDYCYDLGMPEKTSVFLPLGPMTPQNGGLFFYPGTHLLGYLGDAGELDPAILDPDWPVVGPSLEPGDLVLMHECTWHGSFAHTGGPDRIVVQITYQPASDPSGIKLLRGQSSGMPLGLIDRDALFVRSRTSRLRELQAELKSKES